MDSSYNYLLKKYDFENGLFVQIRYGDKFNMNYTNLKNNKDILFILLKPEFYLENIIKYINLKKNSNTPIYIFSDSIDIVKCLFKNKINNVIYTNEGTYETFFCLTHCKNMIISDSSMSYSAIDLNYEKDLKVISPNFYIDSKNNIINIKFKYKSNVTLIDDPTYILDNIKDYQEIINKCNIDITKL